jgi:glyoxylase-like metal-dependent hydrolase (beta-lactamase superfamily II)|tara:strand:- start:1145 stop:1813 length:669 start_codon:yes stop_codon:yes gene_type:complete
MFVVDVAMRCDGYVLEYIREKLNRPIFDVSLVVCTHDDPDHLGGVVALARSCHAISAIPHASKRPHIKLYRNPFGPMVKIVTATREALRERSRDMYLNKERDARYHHVHNHHLAEQKAQRFVLPKQRLSHGKKLQGFDNWEVIHTPGHSWDSICLFHSPSGSLFTGDTLLGSGSKGRLVHPAIYDSPGHLRHTLRRLKRLRPKTVYPGHGSVFSGEQILDHL